MTKSPVVSVAWTMLPASTRRRPIRPLIGALLRDNALFEEQLETLKIDLCILALSLVFSELPERLLQLDLEGTRIDLCKKVSFVDELAFLERNTDELTVHATANRDGIEGRDGAEAIEVNGQVTTLRSGNHDRHYQTARAGTAFALAGRFGSGGIGGLAGVP